MLLAILLLSLVLPTLTSAGPADAKHGTQDLENLVEKLEFRLRDMETRMQVETEKQAKEKRDLEAKNEETEKRLAELEASTSKLRMEVEKSLRKEIASNITNALSNLSVRDLPIVLISAWQHDDIRSPQTVAANFNNADRPGGGSGELDLGSGVFTCFTPGYYTVSFSAYAAVGPNSNVNPHLYMYKNGSELPESYWFFGANDDVGVTSSRILVRTLLYNVCMKVINCKITIFPDSPHGCRRHSGAEDDERRLHPCNHLQH